ncbi:CHAT domain-containing protein, partial [Vararia minispora EC-137]
LTPDDHPSKPELLNNLGSALLTRFSRLGVIDDLQSAIVVHRQAVDLAPDNHPHKSTYLNSLAKALRSRFNRFGILDDLESALIVCRQAVSLTPDGHPNKPTHLNNLGSTLETRFNRLDSLDDLEAAIVVHRQATRFDRLGGLDDLESAIVVKRWVVDFTPNGHPNKPMWLNSLGRALKNRFNRLHKLDDLESAITFCRQAVDLTPDGHPDKPMWLSGLGSALGIRFIQTRNPEDPKLSYSAFVSAADQETGPPSVRFDAVKGCIYTRSFQIALGHATYRDLMNDFDRAFNLIPQVAWLGTNIAQRYTILSSIGEVISYAVSIAIQTGALSRAVEWFDEGRSVVWGQLLQLRSPVDNLRSDYPDLADKLQSLSRGLEVSGNDISIADLNELLHSGPDVTVPDQASVRTKLAQDYQTLLHEIREKDGFKNFLLPRTLAELVPPHRKDGPVIIINVHHLRCDALIVYGSAEPIIHVPLPKLTSKIAEDIRLCITKSLKEAHNAVRGTMEDRVTDSGPPDYCRGALRYELSRNVDSVFADASEVLWLCVVQPILERIENKLADSTIANIPHITWCPTGPLAFLPIHAAGIYGCRGMPDHGMKLSDIIVSSYTPTLSALLRPPHMFADGWPSMKALIVSQPTTPGMAKLPGVLSEAIRIQEHLSSQIKHLYDTDATVDAVLGAMKEDDCQVFHLACHGFWGVKDPAKSAFALYDGHLTLSRLMSISVRNAELAFLSACQTPTSYEELPEEAVHLAVGMLAIGFKSVIGTMWPIGDQEAPIIADEVYRQLKENCVSGDGRLKVAYALHEAAKVLREKVGESNITRWAPYVHFGI